MARTDAKKPARRRAGSGDARRAPSASTKLQGNELRLFFVVEAKDCGAVESLSQRPTTPEEVTELIYDRHDCGDAAALSVIQEWAESAGPGETLRIDDTHLVLVVPAGWAPRSVGVMTETRVVII